MTWFFFIVLPMVTDVRRKTGRNIRLSREKKIVSTNNTTEGQEEFVVMDRIKIMVHAIYTRIERIRNTTTEKTLCAAQLWQQKEEREVCAHRGGRGVLLGRALNGAC